ncbi:MAG: division/cell wall cluster transcriptional repressor MraZ [Desulfatirhabdiaceae bacterium]
MFRGSSFHTIDEKGRMIIPSRFKELIRTSGSDAAMISRLERFLVVYTLPEWTSIENRILSMVEKDDSMRRFRRIFIGGAFECPLDRQGRILIPPSLREYAELNREIVLVGNLDHFEIWSQNNWNRENDQMETDYQKEGVRNKIAGLGL